MKHFDLIVVVSACVRWWWWCWWWWCWWYLTLWTLPMTTYNWLAATGWLHHITIWLLCSSHHRLQTMLEWWRVEVPSSITWRHNTRDSRWQTSDLTFNLLDCGRNLWSRRLVMLYNGPVAVVDPGNKISRYPLFQSSAVQPHSRSYLRRPTPSSGISGMSCFSSLEYNRNYRGHLGSLWSN